jgi:class 3 adenylate cyclase
MDENGRVKRRLTAILAADAVGYSARMAENEERTLRTLAGHRRLIDGLIADHGGRIVGTAGDSVLAEFGSSVDAVRCAVEVQEALATRNGSLADDERLQFRIGINLGDVIVDGADILGDGVNVASRLEGIADPGGICIASSVFDQISGKLNLGFEDIGERSLKNIGRPVRAYRLARAGAPQPRRSRPRSRAVPASLAAVGVLAIALGAFYLGRSRDNRAEPSAAPLATAEPAAQPASAPPPVVPSAAPVPPSVTSPSPSPEKTATANVPPPVKSAAGRDDSVAAATPAKPEPTPAYTTGVAQGRCQRPDGSPGPFARARVQVVDGEIVIAVGEPGQPGSIDLRGRPAGDGSLVLDGFVIPSAGRGRGNKIAARYEGRLNGGRGMLTGNQGALRCSLGLMLK